MNKNVSLNKNKCKNWFKDFIKIFWSELKVELKLSNLLIALFITGFSLLSFILNTEVRGSDDFIRRVISAFGQGTTYLILWRVFFVLRNNSTVDKNRVSYLMFSKNQVTFSKMFVDILVFVFGISVLILTTIILSDSIDSYREYYTSQLTGRILLYSLMVVLIYSLTAIGLNFFNALFKDLDKTMRFAIIGIWLICTLLSYLVFSILSSVQMDIQKLYINNWKWISFMPFLNLGLPSLILVGDVPALAILPILFEILVFILCIWPWFPKKLKEYLCA